MLTLFRYMRDHQVQDNTIRYRWDDWSENVDETTLDETLCADLKRLSQRAIAAFAAAVMEWIVYRYGALDSDPLPKYFIEAAWAGNVDGRYRAMTIESDVPLDNWSGPVRRPIWRAMLHLDFTIDEKEEDGNPEVGAARLVTLADYVMSDPTPFQEWTRLVIARLTALYPMVPDEHLGEVVPREALDLNDAFHLEDTELLVNGFLASLDPRTNPFLSEPTTMLDEGFQGVPYTFSIERDRRQRFEW